MSAHTPGPWTVGGEGTLKSLQGHVFAGSRLVANCYGHQDGKAATLAESDANARLIAAAPRLLEALERAHAVLQRIRRELHVPEPWCADVDYAEDKARAILYDVEGGSNG